MPLDCHVWEMKMSSSTPLSNKDPVLDPGEVSMCIYIYVNIVCMYIYIYYIYIQRINMCMQSGRLLRNLFKQEVQFILLGKVIYLGSILGRRLMSSPHVLLSPFLFVQRKHCIRKSCKKWVLAVRESSQLECQCCAKIPWKRHQGAGLLSHELCLDLDSHNSLLFW